MAGLCGTRGALSAHTLLFDLPPALLGELCAILDSCDGPLGWRGLAERLSNSWLDVRHIEKYVDQGKSGTRELLWSWAQKNKTIGDLLQILQEMGHQRAIHLITNYGASAHPSAPRHQELRFPNVSPNALPNSQHVYKGNDPGPLEPAKVTEDHVLVPEHNEKGVLHQPSISFQSIIEGTKHFHKDFLIGEGEIFEVYKVEIQNQTYAVKLFKQGNTAPLSWHVRISVLIGTSKAIRYLHNTQPCSVICGNISRQPMEFIFPEQSYSVICSPCLKCKSIELKVSEPGKGTLLCEITNILLDDQFQPRLTDFAMAHFRPHFEHHSSTINTTGSGRKHLWYMPEEYIRQGRLSVKTDVYSFGIVIMEVLTGCKVLLDNPKHVQLRDLLVELMEKRGLDSCLSFLDRKIQPCPRNFSAKLFSLAGQCVATRAKLRPTMDEVLNALESAEPSLYFAEDPPTSLKSFRCPSPLFLDNVPSIPVEDDESQNIHPGPHERALRTDKVTQKAPFECSQSEVTFLGLDRNARSERSEVACDMPSSSCEGCWPPELAAASQDLRPTEITLGSSWEVPDHSFGSKPMEKRYSSGLFCSEYEQSEKQ
ncbi:Interleukin-1 receptor-associated kinase 3 [Microtus ochrogaster]|uniref:Interleukin-1 receptor-associated kinase 3 n=1 Tax=Microtus ochrogaster TaxID=79684 RepID=A0A8J6GRY5_MICOH|nr:Interleukin-1 receptor-associated kinase 3 [Microtus ochrogaster]